MIDGTTFLTIIGVWLGIAAVVTLTWATVSFVADELAMRRQTSRRIRRRLDTINRVPRRYTGCIECEGAEALGLAYLIRHQERDHAAGVTW